MRLVQGQPLRQLLIHRNEPTVLDQQRVVLLLVKQVHNTDQGIIAALGASWLLWGVHGKLPNEPIYVEWQNIEGWTITHSVTRIHSCNLHSWCHTPSLTCRPSLIGRPSLTKNP